jgi:hypothetical protein
VFRHKVSQKYGSVLCESDDTVSSGVGETETMILPDCFCWTRFGTEAGQGIDQILKRKEEERAANGGVFFWGIGNALGPSMRQLLLRTSEPDVIFSPMKSAPRQEDVSPPQVVAWTTAETLSGDSYSLPPSSMVTSGYNPAAQKQTHYALVCFSPKPLVHSLVHEKVRFGTIRNLATGRPVAPSQTTAVVERNGAGAPDESAYDVAIRAKLVSPFFLILRDPVPLSETSDQLDWAEIVQLVWKRRKRERKAVRPSQLPFPGVPRL